MKKYRYIPLFFITFLHVRYICNEKIFEQKTIKKTTAKQNQAKQQGILCSNMFGCCFTDNNGIRMDSKQHTTNI